MPGYAVDRIPSLVLYLIFVVQKLTQFLYLFVLFPEDIVCYCLYRPILNKYCLLLFCTGRLKINFVCYCFVVQYKTKQNKTKIAGTKTSLLSSTRVPGGTQPITAGN